MGKVIGSADLFRAKGCARRYAEREFDELGLVRVQSLSELERKKWQYGSLDENGSIVVDKMATSGPRLLVLAMVDENGHRLFTDADADRIGDLDSQVIGDLVDFALQHCGAEEESIEETAKN